VLIAFDPGDTTGFAIFSDEGVCVQIGQIPFRDMPEWLQSLMGEYSTIVVEDYRIQSHKAKQQSGSTVKAAQVIGMLKLFASEIRAKVVMQRANIKSIALKWSQIKLPSDHAQTHQYDAYLHGIYYLVSNDLVPTQLELQERK
jgi:hypothetical protein